MHGKAQETLGWAQIENASMVEGSKVQQHAPDRSAGDICATVKESSHIGCAGRKYCPPERCPIEMGVGVIGHIV